MLSIIADINKFKRIIPENELNENLENVANLITLDIQMKAALDELKLTSIKEEDKIIAILIHLRIHVLDYIETMEDAWEVITKLIVKYRTK